MLAPVALFASSQPTASSTTACNDPQNNLLNVALPRSASVDHIRACQSAFFEDGALSHGGRPPALGPWLSQLLKQDPAEWGDVLTQIGVGEGVVDEVRVWGCEGGGVACM